MSQVLLLANSDEIENKIADGNGRVATLFKEKKPPGDAIEELYRTALGRRPTEAELKRTLAHVESAPDKQKAVEDVLWALLNSKEFMYNH